MDWIHCNRCFIQPGEVKDRMFWLTNCGHMFCDGCLAKGPNNTFGCHACKKSCNIQQLKPENLQGEIKDYFMNIESFIEKALKVRSFQNDHRMKLAQYNSNLEKKTKVLRRQCKELYTEIHELQKKITSLEFENSNLKQMSTSSKPTTFQFSKSTPQSESRYFQGNGALFGPQSTSRQKSHPSRSTQGRIGMHSGYSASKLPASRSSSSHSLNIDSNKRSPDITYLSTSPAIKHSAMLGRTPEYVSQLKNLSFTPGKLPNF